MERTLIIADEHLEAGVPFEASYQLVKKMVKTGKFDTIVRLGDILDLSYISAYTIDQPGLTEGKRLQEDFQLLEQELSYFNKYCKKQILLEGNHEVRLSKFINKNPVLEGIFSMKAIAEKVGVQFIPMKKQPFKLLNDLYLTHGISFAKYFTAQMVDRSGASMVAGHTHRTQNYTYAYPDGRIISGIGIGTLGPVNPDYCAGSRVTGHTASVGVLYSDTNLWDLQTVMIKNNSMIFEGKLISA